MNKPIIFLGPSLRHEEARKIFDADYRPPAKKGDFLRLSGFTNDVRIVGLVDGLFLQDYPPTPIEVYHLTIKKNVIVIGAASIGALRAVELEKYGMIGIGKIFQLYKRGKIDADDEVAVTFADEEKSLQSEAMIDVRFNLFIAKKEVIIDEATRKAITRVAKNLYFPNRHYANIIDQSKKRYPNLIENLEAFRSHIINKRVSLKQRDAIKLIKYVRKCYEQQQFM